MRNRRLHSLFSVAALACMFAACDDKTEFDQPRPADLTAPVPVVPPPAGNPPTTDGAASLDKPVAATVEAGADEARPGGSRPSLFVRSGRCGECHEKIHQEWGQSAHSHASRSPAYRKALLQAGELRELCQSCHLPSQAYGQPDESPERPSEGVACDGCHTINSVTVGKNNSTIKFDPGSGAKYGPIVGATGHYFHDMAYSILHTKAELCSGCHNLTAYKVGDKLVNIPVVSNYADWKLYGKGKPCQDCHMPSRGTEPVAKGAKPRPNVPAHIFAGTTTLGKQIRFEPSPKHKPGEISIDIQHSAGHMLPSGYVDRRLIVRAEFFNASGQKLSQLDRSYGISLVDAAGQPAPFFRAAKIAEDRRMLPAKVYTESFAIPTAGSPAKVTLSLLAATTAPELSAVYGEPELTVIKSTSLSLPVRPGGR